ncbi:MAG: glycosyltransferase [Dehalococcoidia bacterium]
MYKGRILAIGDSALAPTGYGNQADVILPRLAEMGWDVYQFGCNHYYKADAVQADGFIHHKGIKIIPNPDIWMQNMTGIYGTKESIWDWYQRLKPDVVWTINDFYRVAGLTDFDQEFNDRWVHWLPIDNLFMVDKGTELENKVQYMVFFSAFAWNEKAIHLPNVRYLDACYLAVDNEAYRPVDKAAIKKRHGAGDSFVITTVARHQPRKMVYESARAVAKFMAQHPDSIYVCKCNPDDESMSQSPIEEKDLRGIFTHMGVPLSRVLFASNPMDTTEMNELYNIGDVFIHISGGEGFGLPYVESMLAGVPVILSDNTTSPELTKNWEFGFPVKIKEHKFIEMFACYFDLPDVDDAVVQLEKAYQDWKFNDSRMLKEMGQKAREFHSKWCDAKRVSTYWSELFLKMMRGTNPIVWNSFFGVGVGFSSISEAMVPELKRIGYPVMVGDYNGGQSPILNDEIKADIERTKTSGLDLSKYPNIVCWLMETFDTVKADVKLGWSLCESTKLRPFYQAKCNKMDFILTSSDFNKKIQEESGIVSPIRVIPPCVDPKKFPYVERERGGQPFTFLHVGVVQERKNSDQALEGYCMAFPDDGRTKFILKTNHFGVLDYINPAFRTRKDIELIYTNEKPFTDKEMLDLYARADCYVDLSHGEGIGMPDLEAMFTGLPVIGSNWDTRRLFLNDDTGYVLKNIQMGQAYTTVPEDCGQWAYFDINEYVETLRKAASDRFTAKNKGRRAAELVHKEYSPKKAVEALDAVLMDIYHKRRGNTVIEDEYGERYYTEVHKYTPDWHEGVAQMLLKYCDGLKGKVLDIGCGRGYVMKHLLAHGVDVVGIERSKWPVAHPMEGCEGRIFEGDATKMTVPDGAYDWGIAFSLLEHIPEPLVNQVLAEIARTCKNAFLQIAIPMFPGHEVQLKQEDATHICLHPYEWWVERFNQVGLEVTFRDAMNIVVRPKKVESTRIMPGERILVGIPTKDRLGYLAKLLDSLNKQDYPFFDVLVVDDSKVANLPGDQGVMEEANKLMSKGRGWYACRGVGQNQAVAHNNILSYSLSRGYKLVLRVDDDITLEPDFISKLADAFVKDEKVEYAAVGGVFLNPEHPANMQYAPPDWRNRPEFGGTINPCVLNHQVVLYNDVEEREVQHLYSSYMYRPELVAKAGGFPSDLSPQGFREETIPIYTLWLQGWKLKFLTKAVGYHFNAQTGGLRSISEESRMRMFEEDNAKFVRKIQVLHERYKRK